MSIKNEIERLQNAKSGIVSAIIRKGVSVPEGVKLDGMEELIDGIETGVDTSDATASSNEILLGETAYVDGVKVIGTIETFDGSYTCSGESTGGEEGEDVTEETEAYTEKLTILENAITALEAELEGKASGGSGGNVETYTITSDYDGTIMVYTDVNNQYQVVEGKGQYICPANSLIVAHDEWWAAGISVLGGEILLGDSTGGLFHVVKVTGDITVTQQGG